MKKKFICAVCGYIYEGDAAPEKCPICKAPASKFSELKDDADMTYATVHKIGDGKPEGVSEEMIQDLRWRGWNVSGYGSSGRSRGLSRDC